MSDSRIIRAPEEFERTRDRIKRRSDGSLPPLHNYDETAIPSPTVDVTLATTGGRLFYVRRMLRVSRLTIEQVAGLSRGHYGRFEYNHKSLNHITTIYRLIGAFFRLGVSVDLHWLILGAGHDREEPAYNERFYRRYPKERTATMLLPSTEPAADTAKSAPVPRSGVGVRVTVGPPRLKLLPGKNGG